MRKITTLLLAAVLLLSNGGRGFDSRAEDQGHAAGDSAAEQEQERQEKAAEHAAHDQVALIVQGCPYGNKGHGNTGQRATDTAERCSKTDFFRYGERSRKRGHDRHHDQYGPKKLSLQGILDLPESL